VVAVEEDRQGVVVSGAQVPHQLVVTQTLQLCKTWGLRVTFYGKNRVQVKNSTAAHKYVCKCTGCPHMRDGKIPIREIGIVAFCKKEGVEDKVSS
jgi:hypothetical protein